MDPNKKESFDLEKNKNGVVLMMESTEEESFVSMKDLFYAVLRKLWIMIIVAVVLGGALFAYKATRNKVTANVLDITEKLEGETDVQYQLRAQKVVRAKDLSATITRVNSQIDHQRRYVADSVYMQIDAENVYEAKIQFVLTLKDNVTEGIDNALVSAYQNAITGGDYLNAYADKKGIKADYIKEVIYVDSAVSDATILSAENTVDRAVSMTVKVNGHTEEFSKEVSDLIVSEINSLNKELGTSVAAHTLSVVGVQNNVKVDASIRDNQANQTSRIETLQKQIVNYNDSLDQIAKDLGVAGKEDILDYFAAEDKVSIKGIIKSGIKFGVLGFAAGLLLAAAFVALKYLFGKKITTQAQFFSRFKSVKKIGVLKPSGKRSGYAVSIDKKSEDDSDMSAENTIKLVKANCANITRGCEKILITGTGDKKAMDEAVKKLGIKGDYKPDIFSDPDVLKDIPGYDGVVLLEQRNVSEFKKVASEIALISDAGTKILGAVIL